MHRTILPSRTTGLADHLWMMLSVFSHAVWEEWEDGLEKARTLGGSEGGVVVCGGGTLKDSL